MTEPLSQEEILKRFGPRRPAMHRWEPRRWDPKYDQIIVMNALGLKTNIEIGEMFGLKPQQISNIVNCKKAAELRAQIHQKIMTDVEQGIPLRLEKLAQKSVERLESVINHDVLFESKPLEITNLALKILQGIGKFKKDDEDNSRTSIKNMFILSKSDIRDLREAMEKSDEARRLNPPSSTEIVVEPEKVEKIANE